MEALTTLLEALIGRRVAYQGIDYRIIEILREGPAVVVSPLLGAGVIQSDQFGGAKRRVPQTHTLPLFSEVEDDVHPVLRDMLDAEDVERLRASLRRPPATPPRS